MKASPKLHHLVLGNPHSFIQPLSFNRQSIMAQGVLYYDYYIVAPAIISFSGNMTGPFSLHRTYFIYDNCYPKLSAE